jgi:hypothetical protein
MSVASPPVSVEKFRNRIDASSRATVFEVVQGNDKLPDTLRLPDTDDMRSSRNRTFAFPASAAAASGQTRKDSQAESDRDIPSFPLGCPPGPLVSCFEFIDPARFYGQVMASGRSSCFTRRTDRCPEDLSGPAFPLPEKPAAAPGAHVRAPHLPSRSPTPSANAETPPRFGNTGRPWWRSKCRHHRAPGDER